MNWMFWKPKAKLESKFPFEIGKRYIDKKWKDTIIELTAISEDKSEIRYKFIKIDGRKVFNSSIYTVGSIVLSDYELLEIEENEESKTAS